MAVDFSAFRPITFPNGCFFPSSFFNNEILILEIRLLNYKKPLSASVSDAKSMTYWILDIFKYSNLFDILDFRSSDLAIGVASCNSVKCVLIQKSLSMHRCTMQQEQRFYNISLNTLREFKLFFLALHKSESYRGLCRVPTYVGVDSCGWEKWVEST